jgi:hypothetical protein
MMTTKKVSKGFGRNLLVAGTGALVLVFGLMVAGCSSQNLPDDIRSSLWGEWAGGAYTIKFTYDTVSSGDWKLSYSVNSKAPNTLVFDGGSVDVTVAGTALSFKEYKAKTPDGDSAVIFVGTYTKKE